MKNLFKSMMAIAVAAMSFTACSTDVTEDIAPVEKFTVKINAVSPESRTVFGDLDGNSYPTLWEGNEKIKAELNLVSAYNNDAIAISTTSDDKKTATFEATFKASDAESYTIYAACPASAYVSGPNSKYNFNLEIPTKQTPTEKSCDPAAQILVGQSATTTTRPTSVDMQFKHMTAYAKISFINAPISNDDAVTSINIASESHIAGKYNYYVAEHADGFPAGTINVNSGKKDITVNTNTLNGVWVALAPVDVSGTDLTFTINTEKGMFTKTVSMGENKVFKSGVVTTFNVDMTDAEFAANSTDVYTLVTDLSVLAEGDNVIIVSAETDYAIGTDNTGYNRPAVEITKSENTITPAANVGIFTVHDAGTNLYAFKDASNDNAYLYASSSSNNYYNLETQAENDANGHWDITLDSTTGKATVAAQGTNTYNVLHCITSGSGSVYFGATPSTYTKGYLVSLYYKSNGGAKIAIEPQIIASDIKNVAAAGVTDATANIVVRGIASVTATPDGAVVTAASVSDNVLTYTVAVNSGAAREGSIKISGGGVEKTVTVSQLAKPSDNAVIATWDTIGNKQQTWASDTHSTYGDGFSASDSNIKVAYYKNEDQNLRDITTNSDNHIRLYTKNRLVITPLNGKTIKSVTLTTTTTNHCVNITVESDNNSIATADTSTQTISWSGSVDTFIGKPAAQCRISSIKVVME